MTTVELYKKIGPMLRVVPFRWGERGWELFENFNLSRAADRRGFDDEDALKAFPRRIYDAGMFAVSWRPNDTYLEPPTYKQFLTVYGLEEQAVEEDDK